MNQHISKTIKSAIVNHNDKTITFISHSDTQASVGFNEYDEWGAATLDSVEFDYHFLHDEEQYVIVYGHKIASNGSVEIDFDNDETLTVSEIGSY